MSLDAIATVLGTDDFNRLVHAYDEAKRIGRLKFWQEKLLAKAEATTGINLSNFDTFVEVFSQATIVCKRLSKSHFLADPSAAWFDEASEFDPAWITDAWAGSPTFVENLSYEISRSVSKTGEFNLASRTVEAIAGRLTPMQFSELYQYIRDDSQRDEREWRDEFVRLFPAAKSQLPPVT